MFFTSCPPSPQPSSTKDLTAFSFPALQATGNIAETEITVIAPQGTALAALVATFTTTGVSVTVAGTPQSSGVTANDFTAPVVYRVTAEDESVKDYTVSVIHAPAGNEMIVDGAFDYGGAFWTATQQGSAASTVSFDSGHFTLSGSPRSQDKWDIYLSQTGLPFTAHGIYHVSLDASSTVAGDFIQAMIMENGTDVDGDGSAVTGFSMKDIYLPAGSSNYSFDMIMPNFNVTDGRLAIILGRTTGTVTIDNVSMQPAGAYSPPAAPEMVPNGDFSRGQNLWIYSMPTGITADLDFTEQFTLTGSSRGTSLTDITLRSVYHSLTSSSIYRVTFDASSTVPNDLFRVVVSENNMDINSDGNYYTLWGGTAYCGLFSSMTTYSVLVAMSSDMADPEAKLEFHLGHTNGVIHIDNVSMERIGSYTPPALPEMVYNGDFSQGASYWLFFPQEGVTSNANFNNQFALTGTGRGANDWSVGLNSNEKALVKSSIYQIDLKASSTVSTDKITVCLSEYGTDINGNGNGYDYWGSFEITLNPTLASYSGIIIMSSSFDDPHAALGLNMGKTTGDIVIDDVSMRNIGTFTPPTAPEMVWNGDFSAWQNYWSHWEDASVTAAIGFQNAFTMTGAGRGTEEWDVQLHSPDKNLTATSIYQMTFSASSSVSTDKIRASLGENGTDVDSDGYSYTKWGSEYVFTLSPTASTYTCLFVMPQTINDPEGTITFCVGNTAGDLLIDNVSMQRVGAFTPPTAPEMVWNGDFSIWRNYWNYSADASVTAQAGFINVFTVTGVGRGTDISKILLKSPNKALTAASIYELSFDASSSVSMDEIEASLGENGTDVNSDGYFYTKWGSEYVFTLNPTTTAYHCRFVMPQSINDPEGTITFCIGNTSGDILIDNVSLQRVGAFAPPAAPEMVWNGDFGIWMNYWGLSKAAGVAAETDFIDQFSLSGAGRGSSDTDIQLSSAGKHVVGDTTYRISFDASSSDASDVIRVFLNGCSGGSLPVTLGTAMTNYSVEFTAPTGMDDTNGTFFIFMGVTTGDIVIDNVSMVQL